MKRGALLVLLLLAVPVVSPTLAQHMRLWNVYPNLALILTASWLFVWGQGEGMILASVAGIMADMVGEGPLGVSVIGLIPTVLLGTLRELRIMEATFPIAIVTVGLGTLGYELSLVMVRNILGEGIRWGDAILWGGIPALAVNLMAFLPAYALLLLLKPLVAPARQSPKLGR